MRETGDVLVNDGGIEKELCDSYIVSGSDLRRVGYPDIGMFDIRRNYFLGWSNQLFTKPKSPHIS